MDRKTWFGRKKSSEKTYDASDQLKNLSFQRNEKEKDKAELERDLKILNDKLSSAFSECSTKDELVKKHAKMTQDAIAGWEKAESEAISLKRELDEAIQQRAASEERLANLDAALKECMQQLRYAREEQEKSIHDVVMKTSREFEKSRTVLEDRLAETVSRLSRMGIENSHLSKALVLKEKTIGDLNQQLAEMEADFNSLISRLESKEKDNTSLKYKLRVLEKETEIRNEEREFNRRTADASHKHHLESVKKIAKLEAECQRLRLLVQKRLPGPATFAKMKNEVEILGKGSFDGRRRQLNPMDIVDHNFPQTLEKRISILNETLAFLEEENMALKEALEKAPTELSPIELPQDDLSKGQLITEPVRRHELSLTSMSDISSDDKVSCSESWSSALILEPFPSRNEKMKAASSCKTTVSSDMDLMDDFAEMEKLAIASVDKAIAVPSSLETMAQKESTVSDFSVPGCFQEIVKMVLEQSRVTERNPRKVLEDIRVALAVDFSSGVNCADVASTGKINEQERADLNESLHKLIELIEGISLPSIDYDNLRASRKEGGVFSETPTGYVARVFQWKISELSAILNQFVQTCYELSNGVSHPGKFVLELTNALGWIMNHCFSLQDVSAMRDSIKKHFDWDETRSEIEVEIGIIEKFPESGNSLVPKDKWSCFNMATSNQNNIQGGDFPSKLTEGNINPQEELLNTKSANVDLEVGHQSSNTDRLMIELGESEKSIFTLRKELETLKKSKGVTDNETKNGVELSEACPTVPSAETKLENKNKGVEELKATPLELQPQLNRTEMKQISDDNIIQKERRLHTDLEKTSASEKVSECNVPYRDGGSATTNMAGRTQASPNDKTMSRRSSLLGQMQAEDNPTTEKDLKPHKPIEAISNMASTSGRNKPVKTLEQILDLNGPSKYDEEKTAVGSLDFVVPGKRSGGGSLWRKLPWRKKKIKN